jgi:hypothetical protein
LIHIPLINLSRGATAVPVHPLMLLAMVPREPDMYGPQLENMRQKDESIFAALSTGTTYIKKVIVEDWALKARTEAVVRQEILSFRQRAQQVHTAMSEANEKLVREGIPAEWFLPS